LPLISPRVGPTSAPLALPTIMVEVDVQPISSASCQVAAMLKVREL
jgi:hypothetical protein